MRASLLMAALLALAALPQIADAQLEVKRAVIAGRVRSAPDTAPIPRAEVVIVGSREPHVTDAAGSFQFTGIHPGRYELSVRRIGYKERIKFVTVGADERSFTTIDLEPIPQVLEEVRIAGKVVRVPARFEAAYRRASYGFGDFIMRAEIERRNPLDTKSLLEGIPGVRVSDDDIEFQRCSDDKYFAKPANTKDRNKVQVYVNGLQVTSLKFGIVEALRAVHPLDIEIMEVYRGVARIPAEFLADACVVVAIWTK